LVFAFIEEFINFNT